MTIETFKDIFSTIDYRIINNSFIINKWKRLMMC